MTTTTHHEPATTQDEYNRRHVAVVVELRQYLSRYSFGAALPTTNALAGLLCVTTRTVVFALKHLDTEGAIVYGGRKSGTPRSYRLRPDEQHPDDVAFDRDIRQKIASGHYEQGNPLPAQILARRHGLEPNHLPRACRGLIADRLIAYCPKGPLGPGFYVLRKVRDIDAVPAA